jgi:hypothetical protein
VGLSLDGDAIEGRLRDVPLGLERFDPFFQVAV